ncbi:hypothetical protein BBAD15_g1248 [Beauveria bassiana D1-5]|uniref:Antitoxin Xre/MbcA/ParS-like toxin-binding domain-containing protein n=1 Tax=Beauveria bassiana D1-5 TaxID=1245745 RepID=A0A0A2VYL4_BEABA|nr:hypothetical protein [Cedecea neteri]KGQ13001.1 hypothetical protein BBAD15_g1248 [Beauveria bassiana D1-5]WPU23211.1 hypothetical protein RI049_00110 [Cedecea neteri]
MLPRQAGRIEKKKDRVLFDSERVKLTLAKGVREQNNRREAGLTLQLALRGGVSGLEELHAQLSHLLQATEELQTQQQALELNNGYEKLVELYGEKLIGDGTLAAHEPAASYNADPARLHATQSGLLPPAQQREVVNQARLAQARDRLTDEGWLTTHDIALLGGYSAKNVSAQPTRWKAAGKIFSVIKRGVGNVYPRYGLDENYRPLPVMKAILDTFARHKTAWGLAEWFATSNGLLAGKTPAEMVSTYPANVLQAAEYEVRRLQDGAE